MRQWTVLVYMAGDTGIVFEGPLTGEQLFDNLEGPMLEDLAGMRQVGSNDQVAICVQFDSLAERQALRWCLPSPDEIDPQPPEPIGDVNTGEPDSLSSFVAWGAKQSPAEHYALIIWGHGSGWDETRIYDRYPRAGAAREDDQQRAEARGLLTHRGIFGSTVGHIMAIQDSKERALCYDDSARDFLDNAELQKALHDAAIHMGKPKIDLLGLDACLMNMIEVAYQIRDEVAYLVGSEAVVPGALWPWDRILAALRDAPEISPSALASLIVQMVADHAFAGLGAEEYTQSALDLSQVQPLITLVDAWAGLVQEAQEMDRYLGDALRKARDGCLRFEIPGQGQTDYVDLYDLVALFMLEWTGYDADALLTLPEEADDAAADPPERLRWVSRNLLERLQPGESGLILSNVAQGFTYEDRAHGLSIYLPDLNDPWRASKEISPQYGKLAFSDTAWPSMICVLYGQDALPSAFVARRQERRGEPG